MRKILDTICFRVLHMNSRGFRYSEYGALNKRIMLSSGDIPVTALERWTLQLPRITTTEQSPFQPMADFGNSTTDAPFVVQKPKVLTLTLAVV